MAVPLTDHANANIGCDNCRAGFITDIYLRSRDMTVSLARCRTASLYLWREAWSYKVAAYDGLFVNGMPYDSRVHDLSEVTDISIYLADRMASKTQSAAIQRRTEFDEDITVLKGGKTELEHDTRKELPF